MNQPSFPAPFIASLRNLIGAETEALLDALQQPKPVSIRYNEKKNACYKEWKPIPWCSSGKYLEQRPIFTLDPLLHAGAYYVQEASSMFLAQLKPIIETCGATIRALDLCAAPGGKSTLLSSLLPPDGLLVSNEIIRSRASILLENISKWGSPNTIITSNDPKQFGAFSGFFDLLLIDAPCSGEGMFRKDHEAIGEWSLSNVKLCAERQRRIVADAWNTLRENGILIYSTCTFNRTENEENVQWIMQHLGAEKIILPLNSVWGVVESDGGYRFYPHRLQGEGFFVSVLRKTASAPKALSQKRETHSSLTKMSMMSDWLQGDFIFDTKNNTIHAIPIAQNNAVAQLTKSFNVQRAGVFVGEQKGKDIIPSVSLALSEAFNKTAFYYADADLQTALNYLRRENVHFLDAPNGFHVVGYNGLPLGFVKKIGTRSNNLYPLSWRIRMK